MFGLFRPLAQHCPRPALGSCFRTPHGSKRCSSRHSVVCKYSNTTLNIHA